MNRRRGPNQSKVAANDGAVDVLGVDGRIERARVNDCEHAPLTSQKSFPPHARSDVSVRAESANAASIRRLTGEELDGALVTI